MAKLEQESNKLGDALREACWSRTVILLALNTVPGT